MKLRLAGAFASICLCVLMPARADGSVVTAEYVPAGFSSGSSVAGFNNGTYRPGQTFTALVGGVLSEVGVGVWSTSANDVAIELRSTSGGLPTSTVLASATLSTGSAFASGTLYTVDFSSSGTSLDEGTLYALVLRTVNGSPSVAWSGGSSVSGRYTGGRFVSSSNSGSTFSASATSDAVFRVSVATVAAPEPSTFALLGAAGVTSLLVRRRTSR